MWIKKSVKRIVKLFIYTWHWLILGIAHMAIEDIGICGRLSRLLVFLCNSPDTAVSYYSVPQL